MRNAAEFAAAAGIGAAVFIGLGAGVAAADDGAGASSSPDSSTQGQPPSAGKTHVGAVRPRQRTADTTTARNERTAKRTARASTEATAAPSGTDGATPTRRTALHAIVHDTHRPSAIKATVDPVKTVQPIDAGPQTVTTGPPSLTDRIILKTLQTLRRSDPGLFGGDPSGLTSTSPPRFVRHGLTIAQTEYNGWTVWELAPKRKPSGEYVLGVHGGGFVAEANVINWADYAAMARQTHATVVVPIYPLAQPVGTGTVPTLIPPMADYLSQLIDDHGAENVSLYGDSAGGTFAMLVAQELVRRCRSDVHCVPSEENPSRMVLISPVLDLTLSGPIVDDIDDPIILPPNPKGGGPDITGGLSADDPRVNPIMGADLTGLPPTAIYVGTVERPNPGDLMFRDKLLSQDPDANFTVVIGQGQMHDWALGGIFVNSQARKWRPTIYQQLGLLPDKD